jgi:hypothetical protein
MDLLQIIRTDEHAKYLSAIEGGDVNVRNEEGQNLLHEAVGRAWT